MRASQVYRFVRKFAKKIGNSLLRVVGLTLINVKDLSKLESMSTFENHQKYRYLVRANSLNLECLIKLTPESKSQIAQDLFVLDQLFLKREGYFVEFGATNGFDLSNSHLLENKFGWTGILAEPGRIWWEELEKNRLASIIDKRCVWNKTGDLLEFSQTRIPELSSVKSFVAQDFHKDERLNSEDYFVETISLLDLLSQHKAPKVIDYLSIDTEGSEFQILSEFDFDEYRFRVITVEHNFGSQREKLFKLLTMNGYTRVFEEISSFDDWYVGDLS